MVDDNTRMRINKIIRYVKKTKGHSLLIPDINAKDAVLVAYTDATATSAKRKSHAGRIIFLVDEKTKNAMPIHWRSHLPRNPSTSSLHAEAHAVQETVDMAIQLQWLAELVFGLKFPMVKSCYKSTSDIECKRAMPYIQAMRLRLGDAHITNRNRKCSTNVSHDKWGSTH